MNAKCRNTVSQKTQRKKDNKKIRCKWYIVHECKNALYALFVGMDGMSESKEFAIG
jgi:hypothetical protein